MYRRVMMLEVTLCRQVLLLHWNIRGFLWKWTHASCRIVLRRCSGAECYERFVFAQIFMQIKSEKVVFSWGSSAVHTFLYLASWGVTVLSYRGTLSCFKTCVFFASSYLLCAVVGWELRLPICFIASNDKVRWLFLLGTLADDFNLFICNNLKALYYPP